MKRGSAGPEGASPRWFRWRVLAAFWVVQAALAYAVTAAWMTMNAVSGGPMGPLYGFDVADWWRLMSDGEWAWQAGLGVGVFTLLQAMLLLPVRRPTFSRERRGVPLWLSAASAGAAVALLWGAAAAGVAGAIQLMPVGGPALIDDRAARGIVASVVVAWVIATPLLVTFVRRRQRETALGRVAAWLFMGTVVEAVAVVPLDVMMRRKTDCFCDTGTFWALSACGTVGLFSLGPAIVLPLVARRRRRWLAGRCDACGYDMTGTPRAERCPECGTGWRPGMKKAPVD